MRKHNQRCEDANPKGKCKCRCGGALHGINNEQNQENEHTRTITKNIGGELGEFITKLEGKYFTCRMCGTKQKVCGWLGYPHDGGLADKDGNKWWIYLECDKCHYEWSFGKVEHQVNRYKQQTTDDWVKV